MRKFSTSKQLIHSDLSHNGKNPPYRRDRILLRIVDLDMAKVMRDLCGKRPSDKFKGDA